MENEVRKIIEEYFDRKIEDYKFRSEEEEDDIRTMIEVGIDMVLGQISQLETRLDGELSANGWPDDSYDYDR